MKQVIGIYCGDRWGNIWDEKSLGQGIGGSETWAIQLSSVFQKMGFHVIVFGETATHHFAENGVEYVPWQDFKKRCEYQHFNFFITSRTTKELTPDIDCSNIYIMGHDTEIDLRYDTPVLKLDRIKKVMLLSEWQKRIYLANYSGLTDDRIILTCNGVDHTYYENVDEAQKENMMVWSSSPERGLKIFEKYIFPKIKKEIPDFKVKICCYNPYFDIKTNIEGIEYVGKVGKKELSELQKKAKIWVYPNIGRNDYGDLFHETFCITAVENALSKNALFCFDTGGLSTTLKGYENLFFPEMFNNLGFLFQESNREEEMYSFLAEKAIEALKNENKRKEMAENAYSICKKYTWKKCAKDWLTEWKQLYYE